MNEGSLLLISVSSFSHCLLSPLGLLLRKDLIWILLLFSFSSLSPPPPSPSLPLYLSLRDSRTQYSQISRTFSPFTPPSPLASPLRMSCEEAQLHKERLQALAVSQSVFQLRFFCLSLCFCFFCVSLSVCLGEPFNDHPVSP